MSLIDSLQENLHKTSKFEVLEANLCIDSDISSEIIVDYLAKKNIALESTGPKLSGENINLADMFTDSELAIKYMELLIKEPGEIGTSKADLKKSLLRGLNSRGETSYYTVDKYAFGVSFLYGKLTSIFWKSGTDIKQVDRAEIEDAVSKYIISTDAIKNGDGLIMADDEIDDIFNKLDVKSLDTGDDDE